MEFNEEISEPGTPPNIIEAANSTSSNILPEKSRDRYEFVYKKFIDWRHDNGTNSFSENVLLDYIGQISKNLKPSTVWSTYSMLLNTINIKHDVDIAKYAKLKAYLKRNSTGFKSKKAKVLTAQQIQTFIHDAPDEKFLFTKVALIFGIAGACRSHELRDLEVQNVQNLEKALLVTIPNTKTHTIVGTYYDICKKYINLRPPGINRTTPRFFLNFQNDRCTRQVIGINKFGNVPKQIATFLNLENPQLYTGHSLRRSSTTVLADTGANLTEVKQHGGWKSSAVAEQYIEDSMNNKMKRAQKIFQCIENVPEAPNIPKTTTDLNDQTEDQTLDFEKQTLPSHLSVATTFGTQNLPSTSTTEVSTGGWKSSTSVTERYIENSINNKTEQAQTIFQCIEHTSEVANIPKTTIGLHNQTINFDTLPSNLPVGTTSGNENLPTKSTTDASTVNNKPIINNYYNNCTFHIYNNNK